VTITALPRFRVAHLSIKAWTVSSFAIPTSAPASDKAVPASESALDKIRAFSEPIKKTVYGIWAGRRIAVVRKYLNVDLSIVGFSSLVILPEKIGGR
jgi:hypothetical protein